ncbi:MAG: TIGR04552 family protein, partial [Deltaproteobacteria bacterium]
MGVSRRRRRQAWPDGVRRRAGHLPALPETVHARPGSGRGRLAFRARDGGPAFFALRVLAFEAVQGKLACSGRPVAACCRPMLAQPPIPLPDLWTLGDLERMRLILGGGSVIDWRRLHFQTKEEVDHYLRLCLFEPDDPFDRGRLQRILDEAVDYLRTTFRYAVAEEVAQPAQVEDLFLLASGVGDPKLRKIACLVLKVMHVVHHVEARGLLYRARVSEDELCQLVTQRVDNCIAQLRREGFPVVAAAGSVKTRHSLITKLLAKKE